jgi:hypothetical protein
MKEISEQEKMVEKSDEWDQPKRKELMERYIKYREENIIPKAYIHSMKWIKGNEKST